MSRLIDAILDSRYSPEEDRESALDRVLSKASTARSSARPDAAERMNSALATVSTWGPFLQSLPRPLYASRVLDWYRARAEEVCVALARSGEINSAHDRIKGKKLSDFIANKILSDHSQMPKDMRRHPATVARFIRSGLRRAVLDGKRERLRIVTHRIK